MVLAQLGGIWTVVKQWIVPLAGALAGYASYAGMNLGFILDSKLTETEMTSGFWQEGYGRWVSAGILGTIGMGLVSSSGVIGRFIGGFMLGNAVGSVQEGFSMNVTG
jgi:hypothetical protein